MLKAVKKSDEAEANINMKRALNKLAQQVVLGNKLFTVTTKSKILKKILKNNRQLKNN